MWQEVALGWLISNLNRGEDGVAHTVEEFFVGGADGGEGSAKGGFGVLDEVVGTEADAALHAAEGARGLVGVRLLDDAAFVEALEDAGGGGEVIEGALDSGCPFFLREILGDADASSAP